MGEEEVGSTGVVVVSVREFDPSKDTERVEAVERICEVGPSGKLSLFTDLHGDPICRIRNSPTFLMLGEEEVGSTGVVVVSVREFDPSKDTERVKPLKEYVSGGPNGKLSLFTDLHGDPICRVAEIGQESVGMIRGCIKTVTCGKKLSTQAENTNSNTETNSKQIPVYTKLAYILGLRVSPCHRRVGIGLKLVQKMEEWFRENGAEYSYMATENDNVASVKLFTNKCGYSRFRTPSILVNPVFGHNVRTSSKVTIIKLTPNDAESIYRNKFATTEFFPRDIDSVLNNKLTLGTFLAVPRGYTWSGPDSFLSDPPSSWALVSVWNCMDLFTLEVKGASRLKRALAKTTRVLDRAFPWLRLPSIPNFFEPFGFHFMYGLGGEGPEGLKMVRALCGLAHNLAKEHGCGAVATEVSSGEPLRFAIPHWKVLSCAEDLWCIKRLGQDYSDGSVGDWIKSPPGFSIFVDPREF